MKKQNIRQDIISIISFLILCFLDQITKYFAVLKLKDKEPFVIIKDVFELHYLENRGAAFGMLQGKQIFLLLLTGVFLLFMCYTFYKMPSGKKYIPLRIVGVMILAGAVGNMIDRVRMQYVVDFLYFKLIDFPIFNIADCYVTVAAFSLFFLILFYYKDEDFEFLR
ncbi:MAG: signal peptidase II [Lachnospiraceae bacterium]